MTIATDLNAIKAQIRKQVRRRRKALTPQQQTQAGRDISNKISQLTTDSPSGAIKPLPIKPLRVALFLSMDGEIDTHNAITTLWQQGVEVYLPRIHPFSSTHLIFLRFEKNTPLVKSPLGMQEPQLNCSQLCPLSQLDIIFTPLVAFDARCQRLGMGGGFYDRTLAPIFRTNTTSAASSQASSPKIIGLAHDCQQVDNIPTQPWDLPLEQIITPKHHIKL